MIKKENVSEAEWKKLSEEELEAVDGGTIEIYSMEWITLSGDNPGAKRPGTMYRVLDENGKALKKCPTLKDAIRFAEVLGVSTEIIDNRDQQ